MRAPGSAAVLTTLLLAGCNQYDYFLVGGYQQESFSNVADVIFIIDNSSSMTDEAEGLALNFQTFLNTLTDPTGAAADGDLSLSDAVDAYTIYVDNRGQFLDYQLGVTTTSVAGDGSLGDSGEIVGRIVTKEDSDVQGSFLEGLLCEAACWKECVSYQADDCVDSNPAFDPSEPVDDISAEFLDYVCGGVDTWRNGDECGSGTEQGLEAAFLAWCQAADNPPDDCFNENNVLSTITQADAGKNAGMVRDDSTVVFVIVTDEGDDSVRMSTGETDPTPYLELFDQFNQPYQFAVIGPNYDIENQSLTCNSGGAQAWGAQRYVELVQATGGLYSSLESDEGGDCELTDFSVHLENLGNLLSGLLEKFPLQAIPDPDTIAVFVDGIPVMKAEAYDDGLYGDGWSYDPSLNAIEFHGAAVPDYNVEVRIYYKPLEGQPRTLPF